MFKLLTAVILIPLTLSGCSFFNSGEKPSDSVVSNTPEVLQASYARNNTFLVSKANLDGIGYLVVYKANQQGGTGKVVGISKILPSGENKDIEISMSEFESGQTYLALIHLDNGDKSFKLSEDRPQFQGTEVIQSSVKAD